MYRQALWVAGIFIMDEEDPAIISGDVETIVIKPECIELLLFDAEDGEWLQESSDDLDPELTENNVDECCFVTSSGEVVTINNVDTVQTPFYLESYFMDNDGYRSRSPVHQNIIEIDRVTCYECDIVFCNEHRLLEHLMTHIDVYRMGCDVCDKDLNLEEKFQLHMMAVTWQSVYYCDFCRKSCAGVVRSRSQPPPPGKTYMCHDCEYHVKQETMNFQNTIQLYESVVNHPTNVPVKPPKETPPLIVSPALPQTPSVVEFSTTSLPAVQSAVTSPPPTEVLQDHKQKPNSDAKYEGEFYSIANPTTELQDCYIPRKSPPKKENMKCRRPKPKVQIVGESMRQTLKLNTKSHLKDKSKTLKLKCRYCPATFSEDLNLMAHLREKHRLHKLRYVCKLCGKEFVQQRCYENHLSFHQLAKNHMCFVCNLAFLSKYELEQHAQMHDKSDIINTYCNNTTDCGALDLRKKKRKSAA
ncbi:oocyte zinc finger protein XlCOF28 isoform X1 [Nasonia vitripennis]|uniref:C2H2-type domain-containing protein n=2 Tax=Nasonia vitripennis TaxID=7425 RepID=A0A7M7IS71_NASVI|nr:oocyte zinc finger protein XlCOF28 isoform X1 [Nasonia vitripennis]